MKRTWGLLALATQTRRTIPLGPGTPPLERTWPRAPLLEEHQDTLSPGEAPGVPGPRPQQQGAFWTQVMMVMSLCGHGTRLQKGPQPREPLLQAYLDPLLPQAPPGAQAIPLQLQWSVETQILGGNHCPSAVSCGPQQPGRPPPPLPAVRC